MLDCSKDNHSLNMVLGDKNRWRIRVGHFMLGMFIAMFLMSCIGQNPSMAHMMFIEPEIGGTFGKGQRINNRADFEYLLSNYEVGIYSGTLPRVGFELGTSGLTGRIGVASRNVLGANAWFSIAPPWSSSVLSGFAVTEKFQLRDKWSLGFYQFISRRSEYPMVEELWSWLEFEGYFYETGLGMVVRTIQYQTAIYSLEANVSRQIGENTFRFAVAANMSLNR